MRLRQRVANNTETGCDLCGRPVTIGADGRCALGHRARVVPPPAPVQAPEPALPAPVDPVPTSAPAIPLHPSTPEPTLPPAAHAAADPLPDDAFHHPYDEVLAWEEELAGAPDALPMRTPGAPVNGAAPSRGAGVSGDVADLLLSHGEQAPSVLDVTPTAPPAAADAPLPPVSGNREIGVDEDEEEDRRVERRRTLAVLGGGVAAAGLTGASVMFALV